MPSSTAGSSPAARSIASGGAAASWWRTAAISTARASAPAIAAPSNPCWNDGGMRNRPLAKPDESLATLKIERQQRLIRILAAGEWVIGQSQRLDDLLRRADFGDAREAEIDGSGLTDLDSAGAWLILRTKRELEQAGVRVRKFALPDRYMPLVR